MSHLGENEANQSSVTGTAVQEMRRVNGLSLDRIRNARQGRYAMRRLSSMGQAYYLAMAELDGDLGGYLRALTVYDGLTVADLAAAWNRYLAGQPLVQVVVD